MQPYRIKVVEPLNLAARRKREQILKECHYNLFKIPAKYVYLDLISDSGTGAMSAEAWTGMMRAREDFSGQEAYEDLVAAATRLTHFPYIQPVHQGRAAETLLLKIILRPGDIAVSNTHFESTRANVEMLGCRAIDMIKPQPPFCGNLDLDRFNDLLVGQKKVRLLVLTLTNNVKGGQPVSLENMAKACSMAKSKRVLVVFDASRFADNAFLIKDYTRSRAPIVRIAREMFKHSDMLYMSSKKDGLVSIGGFIALRKKRFYEELHRAVITHESYPTSGGLAARDLAAMAVGLKEAVDERFLRSHVESIRHLGKRLKEKGVTIFEPIGGHGIVVQPQDKQPYSAFALGAQIYLETGVRGGVFDNELRLAVPRRVYTAEQLEHVADSVARVYYGRRMKLALKNKPRDFFSFFAEFRRTE